MFPGIILFIYNTNLHFSSCFVAWLFVIYLYIHYYPNKKICKLRSFTLFCKIDTHMRWSYVCCVLLNNKLIWSFEPASCGPKSAKDSPDTLCAIKAHTHKHTLSPPKCSHIHNNCAEHCELVSKYTHTHTRFISSCILIKQAHTWKARACVSRVMCARGCRACACECFRIGKPLENRVAARDACADHKVWMSG